MGEENLRVYLCGPMRAIPEFNRPAFRDGARRLREAGYEVFSPAEHDESSGFDWTGHTGDLSSAEANGFSLRKALGADLAWICAHADAIAVLPGWQQSLGATAETATARALGLPVLELAVFRRACPAPATVETLRIRPGTELRAARAAR